MRALLSVANRDGIAGLARDLLALDVEVYATDGTRDFLAGDGIEVGSVSDLTGLPQLIGGQVKTFHPAIYAGILARRDVEAQMAELAEQGIGPIDLVVVNVSPFAPAVGAQLVGLDEAIEMIDVGGAALLGAAARNAAGVAAMASPDRYRKVVEEIKALGHV
ncbi:MAG TPA: bifunctional phosphoribosylaminoimidazolecarboxamide formyltransferase/IMP cyclohydrolase, partial [Candidatus Limnocylindrales bacterium]|nr:bifunctional phosphoribosylaminoimidazolecarboxamide formyltransferase/IMP cyclohydrolase [Candidatus Limnocylindrales bacterium]